jgi:hypothetical protein
MRSSASRTYSTRSFRTPARPPAPVPRVQCVRGVRCMRLVHYRVQACVARKVCVGHTEHALLELIQADKPRRLLLADLGCATGWLCHMCMQHVAHVASCMLHGRMNLPRLLIAYRCTARAVARTVRCARTCKPSLGHVLRWLAPSPPPFVLPHSQSAPRRRSAS